jgi:hypothetical protein
MTDQSTELTDLIADARLVLAYAARTGRLPSKSLAEAVAHASSGPADNTSTEDRFMALTSALNESMRGIAPITLYDLGSKYQPYPSSKGGRFKRIAFSIIAVVLVVVTAYYTQVYSQVNSILLVLRDIQTQNAIDKAERLFRFTLKNHQDLFGLTEKTDQIEKQGKAEKKEQDEIVFEPYLKYYLDLLRLNDQLSTYIPLSLAITSEIAHPLSTIYSLVRSDAADVTLLNQLNYRGGNYDPPEAKKDQPPLVQEKAKNDDAVPVDKKLINKQWQLMNFLTSLGLFNLSPFTSNYISAQIYECQKLSSILGFWMLPALYGLLGAVVFQMRAILNPLIPDPPLERLLIRFSLGVLAGVSISWLFASTPGATPAKLFEAQSVNTTLFGVSFLLGFSIDVFFSLLDRAVEKLSDTIAKKNAIDKKGK